jgi:hypothetical protein
MGLVLPVAVLLPGDEVTVYPVIVGPPLEAGGVKLTEALALPADAVPIAGAPGTEWIAKFAVMVIDAVTLDTVSGLLVVVTKPPVPVQFTNV